MASDTEVTRQIKAIAQELISFHRLSEAFFDALPNDFWLHEEGWDAIEHALFVTQHEVNVKVGHLLDILVALRNEWSSRQWDGVVLGLLMARREDLISAHPLVENAWVHMQAQQLLKRRPTDPQHNTEASKFTDEERNDGTV